MNADDRARIWDFLGRCYDLHFQKRLTPEIAADISNLLEEKGERLMDSPIMTMKELAAYLGVHSTTIYRLLKQNGIPAFRVGSDWRFHRDAIKRWMDEQPSGRISEGLVETVKTKPARKSADFVPAC